MEGLLIWLSGASREVLRRCPDERGQYLGLGGAILVSAVIAGAAVVAALQTALNMTSAIALPLAVVFAVVVMAMDRSLVVSLRRQVGLRTYLAVVIPRVLLGMLCAVSIAVLVLLDVAHPDVDKQIIVIQHRNVTNYFASLGESSLSRQITTGEIIVHSLETTIDYGKDPSQDPKLKNLSSQLQSVVASEEVDYASFQCQIYGTANGQHCTVTGFGPLALVDEKKYQNDVVQVSQLQSTIVSSRNKDVSEAAQAGAVLPSAEEALKTNRATQARLTASFLEGNSNVGVLIRLQAMEDVSARGWADIARWLLLVFLVIFACLPVLLKVLLNIGPEGTYDKILALDQEIQLQAAREAALRREAVRNAEAGTTIKEVQRLLAEWETKIPETRDEAVAVGQRLARAMVRDWENRRAADTPADATAG